MKLHFFSNFRAPWRFSSLWQCTVGYYRVVLRFRLLFLSLFGLMCRSFQFHRIFFILAWWRKTIQSKQIWGLLCQKAHRKVRVGFEKKNYTPVIIWQAYLAQLTSILLYLQDLIEFKISTRLILQWKTQKDIVLLWY